MRELINKLFRWIARNVVNLIVVIAILLGGGFIMQQWETFQPSALDQLHDSKTAVEKIRKEA
jgi:predicted negative regulator of RcsB-dependent stress response